MSEQTPALIKYSARPDEGLSHWERFIQSYQKGRQKADLNLNFEDGFLRLFGNSRFLTRYVTYHPHVVDKVHKSKYLKKKKTQDFFYKECAALLKKHTSGKKVKNISLLHQAIKEYKYVEFLRITIQDLAGCHQRDVLEQLSSLAYAILAITDEMAYGESVAKWGVPQLSNGKTAHYHILAMGKMGGYELNYSSDIDLLAISQSDQGKTSLGNSIHEFFVRHLQNVTHYLQHSDENGFLYRVDWDLRPEGKAGTLINSLAALEAYYTTFGQDWERQALTRAHIGCGDATLGLEFMEMITPFVYRKYHDLDSIRRLQEMKVKIQEELSRGDRSGYNVKLGIGGIREIEFLAQSLLLVFGGRHPELRSENVLDLLQNFKSTKLMDAGDADFLGESYLYLRKLEHRLQLVDESQTHTLKNSDAEHIAVARRMGYLGSDTEVLEKFDQQLSHVTGRVNVIFNSFFNESTSLSFQSSSVSVTADFFKTVQNYKADLAERLAASKDFEDQLDVIRIFKKEKQNQISELENEKYINRQLISLKLSCLAEAICQISLDLSFNEMTLRYGNPVFEIGKAFSPPSELIVLGMGKFGGYEISYSSDLDLIFIFSENGHTTGNTKISNGEFFAKVVQRFISILSVMTSKGFAYEIDTELRPSGHQGPLVTTLESFIDYQKNASQVWESQALLRSRPIAGASHLGRIVRGHIRSLLFSSGFPEDIRAEMHGLRMRVEKEVAKEGTYWFDFKLGLGGIMDIEFIVQYLQLTRGFEIPKLQSQNTFEVMDVIVELNLLGNQSDALTLREAYLFYRDFEANIGLLVRRSCHRLKYSDPIFKDVAHRMHFSSTEDCLRQYKSYAENIRKIYNVVFQVK